MKNVSTYEEFITEYEKLIMYKLVTTKSTLIEKMLKLFLYDDETHKSALSSNICKYKSLNICNDLIINDLYIFNNNRNDLCHEFGDIVFAREYLTSIGADLHNNMKSVRKDDKKFLDNLSSLINKHNRDIQKVTNIDKLLKNINLENKTLTKRAKAYAEENVKIQQELNKRNSIFNKSFDASYGFICGIKDAILGRERRYAK